MTDPLNTKEKIRLSRVRSIGWRCWDPIALLNGKAGDESVPFSDEYDAYLIKAAVMLRRGEVVESAVHYLVWVESVHMGLGVQPDTQSRAEVTVAALAADASLWCNT